MQKTRCVERGPITRLLAIALLALTLVAAPGARAEAQEGAIQRVISEQIAAFRSDDFAAAFTHASPSIRRMFGTAERFGAMVRQGYPMVWRPDAVRFGALEERGGRLFQPVFLTDAGGTLHIADYEMIAVDGVWKINGVTLRRPEGLGA